MNIRVKPSNHPIITVDEAKRDGLTRSFLMTVANSLERIASQGYFGFNDKTFVFEAAYSSVENLRAQAQGLRRVARQL